MNTNWENDITKYAKKIYEVCSKETCYHKVINKWDINNKFWGHCAIVTLLINDKFGGQIKRGVIAEEGVSHYWNNINGKDYDVTICQYNYYPTIVDITTSSKEYLLKSESTLKRYLILKQLLK